MEFTTLINRQYQGQFFNKKDIVKVNGNENIK